MRYGHKSSQISGPDIRGFNQRGERTGATMVAGVALW